MGLIGAMRDTGALKGRIGEAEQHLLQVETAHNRECETLIEMWRQINDRFARQETEIARYRTKVELLTRGNDELGEMVDQLLATIEGGLGRARNDTVPRIAGLAQELLASEPAQLSTVDIVDETAQSAAADIVSEPPAARGEEYDEQSVYELLEEAIELPAPGIETTEESQPQASDHNGETPAGPGISNLISRIEGLVGNSESANRTLDVDVEEDELNRELKEIESLRNELSDLRERITATG